MGNRDRWLPLCTAAGCQHVMTSPLPPPCQNSQTAPRQTLCGAMHAGIPEETPCQLTCAAAGCQRNMTSNLQPPMARSARQPSTAARSLPAAPRRRLLSCTAAAASSCCRATASACWAPLLPAPDTASSACRRPSSAAAALACSRTGGSVPPPHPHDGSVEVTCAASCSSLCLPTAAVLAAALL